MENMEEDRDLTCYVLATPNTPLKALGMAFQGININPQSQNFPTNQYQQTETNPKLAYTASAKRPAHERLAGVLNKALPLHPKNADGIAQYNVQVLLWHSTIGLNRKGPNETRPYPLTPGTVPVASGECWKCGQLHSPSRTMPRTICTRSRDQMAIHRPNHL